VTEALVDTDILSELIRESSSPLKKLA